MACSVRRQISASLLAMPGFRLSSFYSMILCQASKSSSQAGTIMTHPVTLLIGNPNGKQDMGTRDLVFPYKNGEPYGESYLLHQILQPAGKAESRLSRGRGGLQLERYDNGRTKFWEIGNETYGNWEAGYMIDVTKNQDQQPAVVTGALYGQHVNVFADSMRAAATI